MGADLRRILVVDVEATCWETREEQGDRPNEIIEIGICELNLRTGDIRMPDSYVVKPRFTEVSPFCTQLTGWTKEQIAEGGDIGDILKAIRDDYGFDRDTLWCSYGEFDRIKLGVDGRASVGGLYGIHRNDNPFARARSHLNIKTLFAIRKGLRDEVAMDKAIRIAGEQLEGRHHNGAADAFNIAKLARLVLS
jgi:inhibitor of KinA sporulation pathway (predicted exonuclease)